MVQIHPGGFNKKKERKRKWARRSFSQSRPQKSMMAMFVMIAAARAGHHRFMSCSMMMNQDGACAKIASINTKESRKLFESWRINHEELLFERFCLGDSFRNPSFGPHDSRNIFRVRGMIWCGSPSYIRIKPKYWNRGWEKLNLTLGLNDKKVNIRPRNERCPPKSNLENQISILHFIRMQTRVWANPAYR